MPYPSQTPIFYILLICDDYKLRTSSLCRFLRIPGNPPSFGPDELWQILVLSYTWMKTVCVIAIITIIIILIINHNNSSKRRCLVLKFCRFIFRTIGLEILEIVKLTKCNLRMRWRWQRCFPGKRLNLIWNWNQPQFQRRALSHASPPAGTQVTRMNPKRINKRYRKLSQCRCIWNIQQNLHTWHQTS
jgi:hypothetical protein